MPIDYSKWDKLELSDDDDFECHPNVDKASFIRWKQADIHAKREERRQKISALKQKISQDDVLLEKIDNMIQRLQNEGVKYFFNTIEELRETNKAIESKNKTTSTPQGENETASMPQSEHVEPAQPSFDQMMGILFEKIRQEVNDESPEEVGTRLIEKLKEHREKLSKSQKDAKVELEKEEMEAKKKIIVDDLHTGFDKAVVNKVNKPTIEKPKKSKKKTEKSIEVLNPDVQPKPLDEPDKISEDTDDDDDEALHISDVAKEFAIIKNYSDSFSFITKHPEIISPEVVDQILAEAFRAQLKGKAKYAKQCVHQGWLLQYCQKLGKDGVTLFFKRITSTDPQARDIFLKDVNETYERIRERCKVMNAEKTQNPQQSQAEQIQIEVTDPNSSLNVHIPDEHSEDEKEREKHQIFLTLPEKFREALKTGELTKINKVLGGYTVEEAEGILEICGRAEVLTIEEGIIDATKGETIPGQDVDSSKASQQPSESKS
ncbi:5120_t:CDS:2 [Acaulospora morrowiae]|uniref:Hsp90 chaperone protein kinase-targeting subunit n=1 Tax=Acaulospora morrowiae TaxID=94023 RepID=A0A9N9GLL3_9GLOM|nr:5120_t:CDS:2 [Acaulospora morrowiae]